MKLFPVYLCLCVCACICMEKAVANGSGLSF